MAKRRRRQSGVTVQEINWPIACQHAAPAAAPPSQPLPDVGGESHAAVWDPAALLPLADLQDLRSRSQVATASGNNNAAREVSRAARLRRLQQQFAELCRGAPVSAGGTPVAAPGIFEQFHFTWLFATTLAQKGQDLRAEDPLLPRVVAKGPVCQAMRTELRRALQRSLPDESAACIVDEMMAAAAAEAGEAAAELAEPETGDLGVSLQSVGGQIDLRWRDTNLRLSHAHYGKLRVLWARRQTASENAGSEAAAAARFRVDLFCLLLRYRTIRCSQFHAALPPPVFDWLKGPSCGVQLEGMASPLNCRWSSFCSAFPDTDGPFGSLGSFYSFRPIKGSFEVNPPFVESMYLAVADHCTQLLTEAEVAGEELAFTIIVGATVAVQDGEAWDVLRTSRFSQAGVMVPAKDHQYVDGGQHTRTKTADQIKVPLVSVCDTCVFFWNTSKAAERWPVDQSVMDNALAAFRSTGVDTSNGAVVGSGGSGGGAGGYGNKRKADRVRQRKDRHRQKKRRQQRKQHGEPG